MLTLNQTTRKLFPSAIFQPTGQEDEEGLVSQWRSIRMKYLARGRGRKQRAVVKNSSRGEEAVFILILVHRNIHCGKSDGIWFILYHNSKKE